MRKRSLEMILSSLNEVSSPDPELEQYGTPSGIVAEIVLYAHAKGAVEGRRILELGCGGAPFIIAAGLLGASEMTGIEIDPRSVRVALGNLKMVDDRLGTDLTERTEIIGSDVADTVIEGPFDTVFMNPPFGAQKKGADRPFLDKAIGTNGEIFSLHNLKGIDFVKRNLTYGGYSVVAEMGYRFPIGHLFTFHTKETEYVPVVFLHSKPVSKEGEDGQGQP